MAATPDGGGYWLVASDGGVFAFGDAGFYGSTGGDAPRPARSWAWPPPPTAAATGWWPPTAASSASATPRSTAPKAVRFYPHPIVGITADQATGGYWLASANGGAYSFDALFHGSMSGVALAAPIHAIAASPATGGYLLAAKDGGVFCFAAPYFGSMAGVPLAAPVVGLATAG